MRHKHCNMDFLYYIGPDFERHYYYFFTYHGAIELYNDERHLLTLDKRVMTIDEMLHEIDKVVDAHLI